MAVQYVDTAAGIRSPGPEVRSRTGEGLSRVCSVGARTKEPQNTAMSAARPVPQPNYAKRLEMRGACSRLQTAPALRQRQQAGSISKRFAWQFIHKSPRSLRTNLSVAVQRAALWPGTKGSRLSGLANRLAIEGIVAEQILLEIVKWANQQTALPCRVIRGEESLAAVVGDQKDALRGRGGATLVGLAVTGHEVVARDYSVSLV